MQEVSPEKENEEITDIAAETADASETSTSRVQAVEVADAHDDDDAEDGDLEEELDEALARIEALEQENSALKTRALRAQADAENFKKRSERERTESIKFANKRVFLQILDVLDNFDRALTAVADPNDNFVIGVNMIQKQLLDVLVQNGVEEINAVGRLFDPYLDEALAQEPTDEHEEGTIVEVFQKGYRFQGTLLRATKVKVAAPKPAATEDTDGDAAETEIDTEA